MDKATLEDLLYCIGMESDAAYKNMEPLCKLCGVQFPPRTLRQQLIEQQRNSNITPIARAA